MNDIGVNMDGKKCGTLDFRLGGRRLTHIRTQKIDAFLRHSFVPNGATWSFHNHIYINFLVARCRQHCWSASRAFSHSFCPQNMFVALKIVAIFREFDFFRNKAKNEGRFRTNAGRKAKCGISRTIAGWLTPME